MEGRPIELVTDHESLKWLLTQKELDRQQAKWVHTLSQYDIDIVYRPGRVNPADALSRHPMHRLAAVSVVQTAPELLDKFAAAYDADPLYQEGVPQGGPQVQPHVPQVQASGPQGPSSQTRSSSRIGSPAEEEASQIGPPGSRKLGRLWYIEVKGAYKVCVPSDPQLRQMVLREAHDAPLGAHFGVDKTLTRVQQFTCGRVCREM